jgi:hypothetical protein
MTTKPKKKTEEKKPNKSGAEKPVSLWGASFTDVIKALLKTKPETKKTNKSKNDE